MSNLRLERTNTSLGLVLWLAVMLGLRPLPLSFDWPLGLILLGVLVLIPFSRILLMKLINPEDQALGRWAAWLHVPAGICLMVAMLLPLGVWRGLLVAPWLVVTLTMAIQAAQTLRRQPTSLARKVSLFGPLQLPVGAAWLWADFAAMQPLGFDPQIVRLTAAHFHFAGYVLPLLAGLLLENYNVLACRIAAVGSASGVALVATGITLTKCGYPAVIEGILAAVFSSLVLLLGICQMRYGIRIGSWLLGISGGSLTVATAFALLYALRSWFPLPWLHIPCMWAVHGSIQVLGFATLGLFGWMRLFPNVTFLRKSSGDCR